MRCAESPVVQVECSGRAQRIVHLARFASSPTFRRQLQPGIPSLIDLNEPLNLQPVHDRTVAHLTVVFFDEL